MTLLKGSVSKHVKAKFAIRNFRTQAASRLVLLHWSILINIITASSSIKTLGFTPVTLLRNLPKQFGCNHNMFKMSDENRLTPNSPAIFQPSEARKKLSIVGFDHALSVLEFHLPWEILESIRSSCVFDTVSYLTSAHVHESIPSQDSTRSNIWNHFPHDIPIDISIISL